MECTRCAGLWLSGDSFKHLTEQAAAEGNSVEVHQRSREARAPEVETPPPDGGHRYRPCAVCHQLMVKRNFGRQSGVIIDVCGRHGVWFDADELPRILDWIRAGGLARANDEEQASLPDDATLREHLALGDAAEIVLQRNDPELQGMSFLEGALRGIHTWLFRI
jgi:Zn-finger nucleic acid-binding protein